jgi:Predicted hydrolases of the HAD superfamily
MVSWFSRKRLVVIKTGGINLKTEYRGVVFFDLDGTLLNENSVVSPTVGQAIKQLRQNGYLPVINTGRSPLEIVAAREATGIDTFVSLNGSYIEHRQQSVYQGKIETDIVQRVVTLADKLGDQVAFYTTDQIKASAYSQDLADAYNLIHTPIPAVVPDFYLHHDILMLLLLTRDNDHFYHEQLPELTYYRNSPFSIDTVRQGNSKMHGIKTLMVNLNLLGLPTYAFGDGPNDLPMLSYVDHPVVMANGIPEAKAEAEFITKSNREDGIVTGLQHFALI